MFSSSSMPGNAAQANAVGNFGLAGPSVPYAEQIMSQGFLGMGKPPRSHGHIMHQSNTFIQYAYATSTWEDNSHNQLMEGMFTFTATDVEPQYDITTVVSLPKLNNIFQNAYNIFRELVDNEREPQAVEFNQLLRDYGEQALSNYINMVNKNDAELAKKVFGDKLGDMQTFYKLHSQPIFCYQTKIGILNLWNPTGSVINMDRDTSMEARYDAEQAANVSVVNLNLAKVARVANIFGPYNYVSTGAKVYFILRRRRTVDGSFTHFEMVPYTVKVSNYPSNGQVHYVDPSGDNVRGHVYFVGTVLEASQQNPHPSAIEQATGLGNGSIPRTAYQMHATLPFMKIAIGV